MIVSPDHCRLFNQQSTIISQQFSDVVRFKLLFHDQSRQNRRAVACGLLRISISLRTVAVWPDRRRRASLCASRARDAGETRLDYASAERTAVAGKASALLLASDACLFDFRCERLDGQASLSD